MKNTKKTFLKTILQRIMLFLMLGAWGTVGAQPIVDFDINGCTVNFKTTLEEPIGTDPTANETSAGLFYRLDGFDNDSKSIGSYYWSETMEKEHPEVVKSMSLPIGMYDVTCYVTRKGGPISTGHRSFEIPIGCHNSPPQNMPSIFNEEKRNDSILLHSSWNVSEDVKYFTPDTLHGTKIDNEHTLSTPWLFITLSFYNSYITEPVAVDFDSRLEYVAAIADNLYSTHAVDWKCVSSIVVDASNNKLVVTKRSDITTGETHLHMIFKSKDPTVDLPEKLDFFATTEISSVNISAAVSPDVSGSPHDPNKLTADRDTICPCQPSQKIIYRVRFQNLGKEMAENVYVTLMDDQNLIFDNIQLLNNSKTYNNHTIVDPLPLVDKTFKILNINLNGLKENVPESSTFDYFEFEIPTKPCLTTGTVIKPRAGIVFQKGVKQDTIYTNLEQTVVFNHTEPFCEKACVASPTCLTCPHQKCWFFEIFHRRRKCCR